MAGRFPLLTDEHISKAVIKALGDRGWDVLRAVDATAVSEAPGLSSASRSGGSFLLIWVRTGLIILSSRLLILSLFSVIFIEPAGHAGSREVLRIARSSSSISCWPKPRAGSYDAFIAAAGGNLRSLFVDQVHPNERGYDLTAQSFFEAITRRATAGSPAAFDAPLIGFSPPGRRTASGRRSAHEPR